GDRERCLAAGMDDYISKPVRPEELAGLLARWLPREQPAEGAASAAASEPDAPVAASLDASVLAQLGDPARGGDPAFLTELIALFRDEAPKHVAALQGAAAAGDAAKLLSVAHTLKGSGSYLGATHLRALCEELEAVGRAGTT